MVTSSREFTGAVRASFASPSCRLRAELRSCIPLLRAMARLRLPEPGAADLLVEETLRAACARRRPPSAGADIRLWLLRLQRDVFEDGRARWRPVCPDGSALPASDEAHTPLRRALQHLDDDLREAVFLHDGAGLSLAEIADVQGCSTALAARRIERAGSLLAAWRSGSGSRGAESRQVDDGAGPEHAPRGEPDFEVCRAAHAAWRVRARSAKARAFMAWYLAPGQRAASRGDHLTDRDGANDLVLHLKSSGYAIDLVGPRGALRL